MAKNNFNLPAKGQSIYEFLSDTSLWETIHAAIEKIGLLETKLKQVPDNRSKKDKVNPVFPMAINGTGDDLGEAFSIVSYDEPFVEEPDGSPSDYAPKFCMDTTYRATIPNGTKRWGVFNIPVLEGGVAPIIIQGIAHVQIDVTDEAHNFAKEIPGDVTKLRSTMDGTTGSATILWKESGEGLKWASILLGRSDGIYHYLFTLNEDMGNTVANTGLATIQDMDDVGTIDTDFVRDPLGVFDILESGDRGICILQNEKFYIIQADKEC